MAEIGFSSMGMMRKKFGETIGIMPKPIQIATISTLLRLRVVVHS